MTARPETATPAGAAAPPLRDDLVQLVGYHSPQVAAEVRLNTNESPFPPPQAWRDELAAAVRGMDVHRYPDREAGALRAAVATLHGVGADEVFCANGSNEVLQCLLLAYGGPGRRVALFEPTYSLHTHIARLVGTEVVAGQRDGELLVDPEEALALLEAAQPVITFLASPNNPTGRCEPTAVIEGLLDAVPGLLVVDEAYGQFAPRSALELRARRPDRLVVVRTFSKTWAMAGVRLGYLVADPAVVEACQATALPYHLSSIIQTAGVLALGYEDEMRQRVAEVAAGRDRLLAALRGLAPDVEVWPSDANFVLFRPRGRRAVAVWQGLLDRGVLIRDCSTWTGLTECLRVTVGTAEENTRFLDALGAVLAETPPGDRP